MPAADENGTLAGNVGFVTGAARGIGRATASQAAPPKDATG
jgi:NAD(P)-dependent dehydrogenase (short-subunit alcohol dehydrogenase family)